MSAHVTHVQRQVTGKGVLDAQGPIHDVGRDIFGIYRHDAALLNRSTTDHGAGGEDRASPFEARGTENGRAEIDGAAKGLWARVWRGRGSCAAARWDGGQAATPEVIWRRLQELGRVEHRIDDAAPAPDHRSALAGEIPSKTQPWREVLVICFPERIAHRRLTLLDHSQRWIEIPQEIVFLLHGSYEGVAQAQVDYQFRGDAPVILDELGDGRKRIVALRRTGEEKRSPRIAGEEVLEWAGCCSSATVCEPGRFFAPELDAAARVV